MSDPSEPQPARPTQRRRRRRSSSDGPVPAAAKPSAGTPQRRPNRGQDSSGARGLRELVGAGRSQVGVSGALRARDVNRPTDQDIADAEQDVELVRRNWRPNEE